MGEKKSLAEIVKDAADRFDKMPEYRASVDARTELHNTKMYRIFNKAAELFENGTLKWTRGVYYEEVHGQPCACAMGALNYAYYGRFYKGAQSWLELGIPFYHAIMRYNDNMANDVTDVVTYLRSKRDLYAPTI
jgi:hypothetical protein